MRTLKSFFIIVCVFFLISYCTVERTQKIDKKYESICSDTQEKFLNILIQAQLQEYVLGNDNLYSEHYKNNIIKINANKLFREYHKNEVKADSIYKNKPILISGIVKNVGVSFSDEYSIDFITDNDFMSVHATFNNDYKNDLANLDKGDRYYAFCNGGSIIIGSPSLKDCKPAYVWIKDETIKLILDFRKYIENAYTFTDMVESNNDFLGTMFTYMLYDNDELDKLLSMLQNNEIKKADKMLQIENKLIKKIFSNKDLMANVAPLSPQEAIMRLKEERKTIKKQIKN